MRKTISKTVLFLGILLSVFSAVSQQQNLELKDIWASQKFSPKGVQNFISMNDGKRFVRLEDNEINSYDFKSGKKLKTLVGKEDITQNGKTINIHSFTFSADENKVLIQTQPRQLYRHSFEALAYVYDLKNKTITSVFGQHCRYPSFSPDGNKVAAVLDNNILVQDLDNGEMTMIGGNGMPNHIINGAVDWVYEEEFSMSRGFEWSPDGKRIAYYRFEESRVPEFTLEYFNGKAYPDRETYRYPKAGEQNSVVSVFVFEFENFNSFRVETTEENDSYLPRIQWASNELLYIQKLNRHQNHLQVLQKNVVNNQMTIIWEEKNPYYIDINNQYYFDQNGNAFLFLSEMNGFNQILRLNTLNREVTAITEASYDVDKIVYYDAATQTVYYTSAEVSPTERHLYKVEISKKKKTRLTQESGWHNITFTKGGLYYLDIFSTFTSPAVYSLYNKDGKLVRILEDNRELVETLKTINLGESVFGKLTTGNGDELNYWQILPPDFNKNKKYPVLFFVYGGPGSQTVKNAWGGGNFLWHQLLAQKGYIIMSVDNRGTGFRGQEFKKCTYLNLGKLEIEDQILSAKWIAEQPYADETRIGIWGWSYGGFMSSLGITLGNETFKTAIAVAPVTHWKYYDNIYTERYMRTPKENPEGYDHNAPLTHADKIKGNYLLIHGMADDNVHLQHATEMTRVMIEKNIPFQSEFYPNKNHGIYGGMTRLHLYNRMTDFILGKL